MKRDEKDVEKEIREHDMLNEVKLDTRQRNVLEMRFNLMRKCFDEEETQRSE